MSEDTSMNVDYPRPPGRPSWSRVAPDSWTPAQRDAAQKFWEQHVKAMGVTLTAYGYLLTSQEPMTDAARRAREAKRQRDRRGALKAAASATISDKDTVGGEADSDHQTPVTEESVADPVQTAKRGRKRGTGMTIEERRKRDAERQRNRRAALKHGGEAPAANPTAQNPRARVVADIPVVETSAQAPSTETETVQVTLPRELLAVVRRLVSTRNVDLNEQITVSEVIAGLIRDSEAGLRAEIRARVTNWGV